MPPKKLSSRSTRAAENGEPAWLVEVLAELDASEARWAREADDAARLERQRSARRAWEADVLSRSRRR